MSEFGPAGGGGSFAEQGNTLAADVSVESQLVQQVQTRQQLVAQIKQLEAEKKTLDAEISGALVREGKQRADVGDYSVSFNVQERRTLDKMRLVELGVSTEIIVQAEKVTQYTTLQIRERKTR